MAYTKIIHGEPDQVEQFRIDKLNQIGSEDTTCYINNSLIIFKQFIIKIQIKTTELLARVLARYNLANMDRFHGS